MNEYINLTLENIDEEHICCAIGDPKHQNGVLNKKEWIKSKLNEGHVFRKLNARGKIFIEYEPIETAWVPIDGKNIGDYELLALQFDNNDTPKFNDNARNMQIDTDEFTIYYSPECPYVEYEVNELIEYAKQNNLKINFIKIDTLEKAKNAPCVFNNWANFYKGKFISNTILNANSFEKLIK